MWLGGLRAGTERFLGVKKTSKEEIEQERREPCNKIVRREQA